MSCVFETRVTDSPCLIRCLLDLTSKKLRCDVLKFFVKVKDLLFHNTLRKRTLGYSISKTTLRSVFIFQPLFVSRLGIELSLTPKLILSLEK